MKCFILLQIFILCILFYSCSSQKAIIIDSYKDNDLTDVNLSIVKPLGNVNIQNPDDVTNDLGEGNPDTVYFDFLKNKLLSYFKENSYLKEIKYIDTLQTYNFKEKVLSTAKDGNFTAILPIEYSTLPDIKSDFILFFYNIEIYRSIRITGFQGQSIRVLNHKVEFVLWDNVIGTIVSYGILKEDSDIIGIDELHWESVIESAVTDIIDFSPFQMKYHFKNF